WPLPCSMISVSNWPLRTESLRSLMGQTSPPTPSPARRGGNHCAEFVELMAWFGRDYSKATITALRDEAVGGREILPADPASSWPPRTRAIEQPSFHAVWTTIATFSLAVPKRPAPDRPLSAPERGSGVRLAYARTAAGAACRPLVVFASAPVKGAGA